MTNFQASFTDRAGRKLLVCKSQRFPHHFSGEV